MNLIRKEILAIKENIWHQFFKKIEKEKIPSAEYWRKIKQISQLSQKPLKQRKKYPTYAIKIKHILKLQKN